MNQKFDFREINCPVCDRSKTKFLGWRGGEAHREGLGVKCRIVKCRHCHTIFPNPMPYPSGEDIRYADVDGYFEDVMRIDPAERISFGTQLAEEAERLLGFRGKFLDIGCGRGEIVKAADDLGWEAKGCDISEQYVEYARNKYKVDAYAGTAEELKFADNSFDFISLVEVIEHLYDPLKTISELHRIMKKDGILYLSTPNEESIYQAFGNLYYKSRGKNWVVNLCPTWNLYHIVGFSPRSLKYLLEHNGFKVEKTVVYPGNLPVPKHDSFIGKIEGIGAATVEKVANLLGKSPYMFTWARKVG
jgi:2-polyprenyl-3-methyl-5-hydroxy-6-metoxy-1,4-benzoquinol methylase